MSFFQSGAAVLVENSSRRGEEHPRVSIYRYGTGRLRGEGLRVDVTACLPQLSEDGFDFWLPALAPSPPILEQVREGHMNHLEFARQYRDEMLERGCQRKIAFLAKLSVRCSVSLGCGCEEKQPCHHRVLRQMILDQTTQTKAAEPPTSGSRAVEEVERFASPVCYAHLDEAGSGY